MKQTSVPPRFARFRRFTTARVGPKAAACAMVLIGSILGPLRPLAAASGEGVRLSPRLEQGRTLTYDISRTLRVEQTPSSGPAGGEATETPVVSSTMLDLTVRLDVGSVRADGTTEVAVEIQSLALASESGGVERTFVHPAEATNGGEGDADAGGGATDPERPSAMDIVGKALILSKPRIVINREGGVGEILGLDNLAEVMVAAARADRTVSAVELSMWGPESLREIVLPVFQPSAPESPARVLGPGDRWTVRRTAELASLGSLVIDEAWTLGSSGDGAASASGVVTVTPMPPRGLVSAAPALDLGASSGAASLSWDASAGSLRSFSRALDITITLNLGDIRVKQVQTSATSINRRN